MASRECMNLICASILLLLIISVAATVPSRSDGQSVLQAVPDALNPKLSNIIEEEKITLYYNCTGNVPEDGGASPKPEPISPLIETSAIEDAIFAELVAVIDGRVLDQCAKCIITLEIQHLAALTQPVEAITNLLIRLCEAFPSLRAQNNYADECQTDYGDPGGLGPWLAMAFSKMSMATGDMHALCSSGGQPERSCEALPVPHVNESLYFHTKPELATVSTRPRSKLLNVLHLSDFHLDSRYDIGSEANCSQYMCCRPYSMNTELESNSVNASVPASRFGDYLCDSPPDLALSAFHSMHSFFNVSELAFTIFTGDVVSHDQDAHLSRDYVAYEEEVVFKVFQSFLPGPVYLTLGNHDTMPRGFNTPNIFNPNSTNSSHNALSWNYDLVSSLWEKYSWLSPPVAHTASTHYGAYSALHPSLPKLRIISLNSDLSYYRGNIFNWMNSTNPDSSGILSWLANELTLAESKHERVWLIAHVPPGYDGKDSIRSPSAVLYSIINRFSPHTIAGLFFGHTHQDQIQLFYDYLPFSISEQGFRDTSKVNFSAPLAASFIGPSITPLTGLNSGYRVYQVDAETYQVMNYQTYIANMSNSLSWHLDGPVWELEYDAREAYTRYVPWPEEAPLNATFWHQVTEKMLDDSDQGSKLWTMYDRYEKKSSDSPAHRGGEVSLEEKVCYIRSGNAEMGEECQERYKTGRLSRFEDGESDLPAMLARIGRNGG